MPAGLRGMGDFFQTAPRRHNRLAIQIRPRSAAFASLLKKILFSVVHRSYGPVGSTMRYKIIVPVLKQNFYFLAESDSGNIVRVVPCQRP